MNWLDTVVNNVSGGLSIGFLAMMINHIAMENIFKGNVGWLGARQISRCYHSWNQACMIYAWKYLEKHRILFAFAQIHFFIGFSTFSVGILSAIPSFVERVDSVLLYVLVACAVSCVFGLYLIIISSVVSYGDDEDEEDEDSVIPISTESEQRPDGYIYYPEDRFVLTPNDESIPQPSRVAQLGESHMRLRLWVQNLEKMIQKNQWTLSRSLNQEMDRTQDHLLQIEQRLFEIGAVESNLNCKELSYWVFTRFYEYSFEKSEKKLIGTSPRQQKSCKKKMQRETAEIGHKIIIACEKSESLQYLTMFQQENLEKALKIFRSQISRIEQLNDISCEQWILQQNETAKQCQDLLTIRKKYLEHFMECNKKE